MKFMLPRNSLQWRLSAGLSAAILLTALAGGGFSFVWSLHEANEILDGRLQDTAAMIASGQMAVPEQTAQLPGSEPDSDMLVVPISTRGSKAASMTRAIGTRGDGLHTVRWRDQEWRVRVASLRGGERVAVAQRTEVRDEIARHSAMRTLIPLLLLVPILLLIVRDVVRRTLKPVASLARHVDSSPIGPAARLPEVAVPDEIAPFLASIRQLLENLTQALEQQRRFVANAAHELRSPMAALQLQVANVERVVNAAEARARVQQLRLGMQRMQHLLEQLLAMATAQAGDIQGEPVDLAQTAMEVLAECMHAADAKAIDLGMHHCDRDLRVAGTPLDVRTLLRNVVDNALKYAPWASRVTVSVYREDHQAVLVVEDEGPGISDEHLQRAFEPFYRVPGTAEPGSGLGLAIVSQIAKRLHGQVILARRVGAPGMRFEYRQAAISALAPGDTQTASAEGRVPVA